MFYMLPIQSWIINHRKTTAAVDGNEELQLPHESRYKEFTEKERKQQKKIKWIEQSVLFLYANIPYIHS